MSVWYTNKAQEDRMALTPFEQVHKNMATLGIRLAESLAVDNMITQAQA